MNVRWQNVGTSDYAQHKVQVWDIVKRLNLNFFEGNMLKYLLRKKGGDSKAMDYQKIAHYARESALHIEDGSFPHEAVELNEDQMNEMMREMEDYALTEDQRRMFAMIAFDHRLSLMDDSMRMERIFALANKLAEKEKVRESEEEKGGTV